MDAFHRQVLQQAVAGGLTAATRGAEDGTLVAANASRHKLVHAATLDRRVAERAAAVAADERGGTTPAVPAWTARTAGGRRGQRERMKRARQRLNELQTRHRTKRSSKRKAATKVVVSVSDPEAAVGRDKEKVYRPLYNVQVVDDLDSPFVPGYEVFARPNDAGLPATMRARLADLMGHAPETLPADTAYAGGADLAAAARAGVTVYAPTPADGKKTEKQIPKSQFHWLGVEGT